MSINLEFFFEVAFDFILFFLLILIIYKLYIQYLSPFLYEQISRIKKHQIDTKNKISLLDGSMSRLECLVESQRQQFNLLDKKVKLWHKFIEQENKHNAKNRSDLIERIKEKRVKQQELFCLFKLEKKTIIPSINQVYNTIGPIRIKPRGRDLLSELVNKISSSVVEE